MKRGDSYLTGDLLKQVSRSVYLSVAVLPAGVRSTVALAYLLARAADTIADTRLIERRSRIVHLGALREELHANRAGRVAEIMETAAESQSTLAERRLIERLPAIVAAYRALDPADRARVRRLLDTIVAGMTDDLRLFPGEDEGGLAALETRADLDWYTYQVAGCVGEFWTDVHVAHRPRLAHWDSSAMTALGVRFGKGLQLTNVLRDVPRDLRHGRCYLPREELGTSASSRPTCSTRRPAPRRGPCATTCSASPPSTTRRAGAIRSPCRPRRRACVWPACGRS